MISKITKPRKAAGTVTLQACVAAVFIVFAWLPAETLAQQGTALERIQEAFARGDARALLEEAADRVEVVLLGRHMHYSRSQAIFVMEEFFREYPPDQFVVDDTSETDGSQFAASQYWSNRQEDPLQVYIHLRATNSRWEVREIRIERRRR